MTIKEINTLLSTGPDWKRASLKRKHAFCKRMQDCQYGYDALSQAWAWYSLGWLDRK